MRWTWMHRRLAPDPLQARIDMLEAALREIADDYSYDTNSHLIAAEALNGTYTSEEA